MKKLIKKIKCFFDNHDFIYFEKDNGKEFKHLACKNCKNHFWAIVKSDGEITYFAEIFS